MGSYTILNYNSGDIMATHALQQGDVPMMCALNDKLLVVTHAGNRASFMEVGASIDPSVGPGGAQARMQ